jgi:uncharacterized protein (DUF1015 family)
MADVRPFRAVRPRDDLAAQVIAPPYDTFDDAEARVLGLNQHSFVHVTRPEVDLPVDTDPHSPTTWQRGRTNLDRFLAEGILVEDEAPSYYLYGLRMGGHTQTGFLAACSVDEYLRGRIRKHEHTRPDKEEDRMRHMEVLDAQVGLVFLAYKATTELRAIAEDITSMPPRWRVVTPDGVEHALWRAPDVDAAHIHAAFQKVKTLYIADGHHRSAAAARVHQARGDEASSTFLAGLFPDDQLYVMAYNRLVVDLNGHDEASFLAKIGEKFIVEPSPTPRPDRRGLFTMYLGKRWLSLEPKDGVVNRKDPVASLDVSVLQDHLLGPILGIDDPRRSERISFVGGIRGPDALVRAVDAGSAKVAFHLFPTGLDQLFKVADAGEVMPPKSTWFEPKLREGVVSARFQPTEP